MYTVSESAVVQRARRHLKKHGRVLRKSRRWDQNFRNYFVIDPYTNNLIAAYDSIADLAKAEGLLDAYETLEGDS